MSEQMVRGYWLSGAVAFTTIHHSPETSERLLSSLPRDTRLELAQVDPVGWYPRRLHVDLLKGIAALARDERAAYDELLAYGQYVGSEFAQGFLKPFMQVVTMKLFAKKLPNIWARDHGDDGRLEVDIAPVDEGRMPLRFAGLGGYDHVGVATLGWIRGAMARFAFKTVDVKQAGWSLVQPAPPEMTCEVSWS